jgi:hypothetical protein
MAKTSTSTTTKRETETTTKRPVRRRAVLQIPPASEERLIVGPTHEQIARRAFELFLARGGEHGHHEEDWARAERELSARPS